MIPFDEFTGGIFDTNCYLLHGPAGNVLIDAPQGADRRFADSKIDTLLLTHGHFDHIVDAAAIHRRHGCRVAIHPDSRAMLSERGFFAKWGYQLEIEPTEPDILLAAPGPLEAGGIRFDLIEAPGHCPGSVCFYLADEHVLFGGDVLFAGGVGRWDLPGGSQDVLFTSIREQLYPLPDDTTVHPGHGPPTTIGTEKRTNPYVRE